MDIKKQVPGLSHCWNGARHLPVYMPVIMVEDVLMKIPAYVYQNDKRGLIQSLAN